MRSSLTSDTFSDVNDDERKKKRAVLKEKLIESCRGTYRGAVGFSNDREKISATREEALETFGAEEKEEEDWMRNRLSRRWKLIYTTALDVVDYSFSGTTTTVAVFPPPPIVVGDIFQSLRRTRRGDCDEIRRPCK